MEKDAGLNLTREAWALLRLVADQTAGSPVDASLLSTNRAPREIAG